MTRFCVLTMAAMLAPRVAQAQSILVFYDQYGVGEAPALHAADELGWDSDGTSIPGDFGILYDALEYDVVVVDVAVSLPNEEVLSRIDDRIASGLPLIINWGNLAADADLLASLGVTAVAYTSPRDVYTASGSPVDFLADITEPLTGATNDAATNGQVLTLTGTGFIAGYADSDLGPDGVIAVTNDDATIVNGFLPWDYEDADNDGDTIADVVEIYMAQLDYVHNNHDGDGDGYTGIDGDCAPIDPDSYPGALEVCDGADNDCDDVIPGDELDTDADGFFECNGDCDDGHGLVYPGAEEICDGLDNDCDPATPEAFDDDLDGVTTCDGDCDDNDDTVYPGAPELCDLIDNDCDPTTVEQSDNDGDGIPLCNDICEGGHDLDDPDLDGVPTFCDLCPYDATDDTDGDGFCDGDDTCQGYDDNLDQDGDSVPDDCDNCIDIPNVDQRDHDEDSFGEMCDCDDRDDRAFPGNIEVCDFADNDCNGVIDGPDAEGAVEWYADLDRDGYGDPNNTALECEAPDAYVDNTDDCNDADKFVRPGAIESCDGIDNDCDGNIDVGCDREPKFAEAECGCQVAGPTPTAGWVVALSVLGLLRRRC